MVETVLIDFDNTINNLNVVLLEELNAIYGTNYQYKDITDYGWFDRTFESPWALLDMEHIWDKVKVNPQAVEVIERLANRPDKYQVYFVTASIFNQYLHKKIKNHINAFHSQFINQSKVIICQDKHLIKGDYLVDDYIGNLLDFPNKKICFAQPWNTGVVYRNITTCYSWVEIEKVITNS